MSEVIDAPSAAAAGNSPAEPLVQITHVTYALYALGLLTFGIFAIAGLIIAYIKGDDVKGTYLESHYGWLIRTFWWGIFWAVLAGIFWLVFGIITLGLGFFISWIPLSIVGLWFAYRIIRGWLRLADKRAI
jgi:uncharacterized membrane protein